MGSGAGSSRLDVLTAVGFSDRYKHLAHGAVLVYSFRPTVAELMRVEGGPTAGNLVAGML